MSDSIYFHFFRQMVGVYMQLCPVASGRNICLSLRSIVLRLLAFYVKYCGTRQEAGVSGGVTIVLTWFWNIFRIFFFVAFLFWPPLISFSYFVFCLPPCTGVSMIFSFLGFFFLFIYLFPPTAATFTIILLVAAWSSLNIIFFFWLKLAPLVWSRCFLCDQFQFVKAIYTLHIYTRRGGDTSPGEFCIFCSVFFIDSGYIGTAPTLWFSFCFLLIYPLVLLFKFSLPFKENSIWLLKSADCLSVGEPSDFDRKPHESGREKFDLILVLLGRN